LQRRENAIEFLMNEIETARLSNVFYQLAHEIRKNRKELFFNGDFSGDADSYLIYEEELLRTAADLLTDIEKLYSSNEELISTPHCGQIFISSELSKIKT